MTILPPSPFVFILVVLTSVLIVEGEDSVSFHNNCQEHFIIKPEDIGRPSSDSLLPSCEKIIFASHVHNRHSLAIHKIKGVEGSGCALLKNGGIVIVITTNKFNTDKDTIPCHFEGIPTFIYNDFVYATYGRIELCFLKCPKKSTTK